MVNELTFGDFSERFSSFDMDCPKCFEFIGSWVPPTIEEVKEWKKITTTNLLNGMIDYN
jgi:hypothetical protein